MPDLAGARRAPVGAILVTCLLALPAALGLGGCGEQPAPPATSPFASLPPDAPRDAGAIANNNRGVALMGYFDYAGARDTFAGLVEAWPDWLDARVNLAIATLNRQEAGDEARADAHLREVLAVAPSHLRAHFVAGLLRLYEGDQPAALEHFRFVAEADPKDAYAAYYVGQLLLGEGRGEAALAWFERARTQDPYLRSAYYGASLALRQVGRMEEALEAQQAYLRLESNPRARLAEFKYTRMGPKAEALAVGTRASAQQQAAPDGPLFGPPYRVSDLRALPGASLTTVDADGDGFQDLYLTAASSTGDGAPRAGRSALLRGLAGGRFERVPAGHPLDGRTAVVAAAWADFDNDGRTDVYLCRAGADELWLQKAGGRWEERSAALGATLPATPCRDVAAFDADHDGDIDLFLAAEASDHLLNNNLDGTFTDIAPAQGLAGRGGGRQILVTDLEADRDADIVVLRDVPPHAVHVNDRLWRYRSPENGDGDFPAGAAGALAAADMDADGRIELLAFAAGGTAQAAGRAVAYGWTQDGLETLAAWPLPVAPQAVAVADFDGSGAPQWLVRAGGGVHLLRLMPAPRAAPDGAGAHGAQPGPGGPRGARPAPDASLAAASVARRWSLPACAPAAPCAGEVHAVLPLFLADRPGAGPALAVAGSDGLVVYPPGPGRHPFAAFTFSGRESAADAMRSNAAGIGTRVALRRGVYWSMTDTWDAHSAPGQSLQPLSIGLGGDREADYLAIDWSDGVFQTELNLAAGELHAISETQRQLASCPVLFAWDGERHRFVTDLLGVGGIGFLLAPGRYSQPRPWERLLLPPDALAARDGRYVLKLTEPMEEVAYLDAMTLEEIRVPAGWDVVVDERHATDPARPPSGELLWFTRSRLPRQARTLAGADVTAAIAARDGLAADPGPRDPRFLGRLAGRGGLLMEFDGPIAGPGASEGNRQGQGAADGRPVLVLDGWVEYPYSQTLFAAWQAGATYEPPSLEASADGENWVMYAPAFGYPAGMPREMTLPLDGLPAGTRFLRLSGTLEIYIDRVRVIYARPAPAGATVRRLVPESARLLQKGFPLRLTFAQQRPAFDYSRREPFWDTRYPRGAYTAFGDVMALAQARDDALVLIGPGEELEMTFAAERPPAPAGASHVQRRFVLTAYGWAKDMDLYTRGGDTVGPMPHRQDDPRVLTRRDALHDRFHVRPLGGR